MANQLNFQDLEVGQSWESNGRTVTQADIVAFATSTGDFNPLHVDNEFASKTLYGEVIAHGLLGISWAAGLSSQNPSINTKAFLGVSNWEFKLPIKCNDTIRVLTTLEELQPSGRKHGRVKWRLDVLNQRDELVQSGFFETIVHGRLPAPKSNQQSDSSQEVSATDQKQVEPTKSIPAPHMKTGGSTSGSTKSESS